MDRAIPEINRHIAARMRQDSRSKHKAMLRNVKPSVDNSLPESMFHPIVKAKKEQMIEGKSHFLSDCKTVMYVSYLT